MNLDSMAETIYQSIKMEKTAGAISTALGKGLALTGGAARMIGRGILPAKKSATVNERLLSLGVKGAAVVGAVKIHDKANQIVPLDNAVNNLAIKGGLISPRPAKYNYAVHLRNNVLAGNISPAELSLTDIKAVEELGMR